MNHGKNLGATSAIMGKTPGCKRVRVSQNLGATAVVTVDTSLHNQDLGFSDPLPLLFLIT